MYHALVRQRVRRVFDSLSRGDYPSALSGVADDVHHAFSGEHPLGGERRSRAAVERWFERLYRLFPSLSFEVLEVVVKGWPWRTAYEDSQKVAEACRRMAAAGVEEAAASPIVD